MTFSIQNINIIEENDDLWGDGSKAGKAYIWGEHVPSGVNPYTVQLFINSDYIYELKSSVTTPNHPNHVYSISEDSTPENPQPIVRDILEFMSKYEAEKLYPACAHIIPGLETPNIDAPLELYDYPFTMMPFNSMCIKPERGGSPHKPVPCSYADISLSVVDCSDYDAMEVLPIGTIEDVEVTVTRNSKSNQYDFKDKTFTNFESLLDWCEESDFDFNLTYTPDEPDASTFYEGAIERMAQTYGKD